MAAENSIIGINYSGINYSNQINTDVKPLDGVSIHVLSVFKHTLNFFRTMNLIGCGLNDVDCRFKITSCNCLFGCMIAVVDGR